MGYVLSICFLLQLQDTTVLKKEIERWKEEVKVQEGKSALNSGRLKSEVDAHKETREKLDKLLTETRAENEKIRSEYSEFIKKLKEEEKRQKFAEQEQSVKIMIDEAAKTELVTLKVKHSEIIEKNETLSNKAQALETDKNEFETTLTKLKVCLSYPAFLFDRNLNLSNLAFKKNLKKPTKYVYTKYAYLCLLTILDLNLNSSPHCNVWFISYYYLRLLCKTRTKF